MLDVPERVLLHPSEHVACQVHITHQPKALLLEYHHILPLTMGGANTDANKVIVCPTGHYNIHNIMKLLYTGWNLKLPGSRLEQKFAHRGMAEWDAAGRPGKFAY